MRVNTNVLVTVCFAIGTVLILMGYYLLNEQGTTVGALSIAFGAGACLLGAFIFATDIIMRIAVENRKK